MSWKTAIKVFSEPQWNYNALCFATKEEAEEWGVGLLRRWTQAESYEAQESDDPVNYRMENGELVDVKG